MQCGSGNPRVWKATIAARFCDVDVEIRDASGNELRDWLWDYDAGPLAPGERESLSSLARTGRVGLTGAQLVKTDAFLEAQPFGSVPAAFGPDGKVESNGIMRVVARLGETTYSLYGREPYEASRPSADPPNDQRNSLLSRDDKILAGKCLTIPPVTRLVPAEPLSSDTILVGRRGSFARRAHSQ